MALPKLDNTKYRWRYIKLTVDNCELLETIKAEGLPIYRFVNKAIMAYAKDQEFIK